MGLITQFRQWRSERAERRTAALTESANDLSADRFHDLLILHARGLVRARGRGQSITRVSAEVENLVRRQLRVIVLPGTYFVSTGGHQNMATTDAYTFTLHPCDTAVIDVKAACINADRPIPGTNDRFRGVARVSDPVARFLAASIGEDPMVVQAGVWTLTDHYTRREVRQHLVSKASDGTTWHPITHDHCDRAMDLLDALDIAHHLRYSEVPSESKGVDYDDSRYVGQFRYGQRHGLGKMVWKSGAMYQGTFVKGYRHGSGTFQWESGEKYVGAFFKDDETGGWFYHRNGRRSWCHRRGDGVLETSASELHRWEDLPRIGEVHPLGSLTLEKFANEACAWNHPTFAAIGGKGLCVLKVDADQTGLTNVTEAVFGSLITMSFRYMACPTYPIIGLAVKIRSSDGDYSMEDIPDLAHPGTRDAVDLLLESGLGTLHFFCGNPPALRATGLFRVDVAGLRAALDQASRHHWSIPRDKLAFRAAAEHYLSQTA